MLLILLEGEPGQAYNLGNDHEEVTMRQVAEALVQAIRYPHPIEFRVSPDPHYTTDNPQRRCPDLGRIRTLGYDPQVDLLEGLHRTFQSYVGGLA
jgi:dTDP-glucose 4,6-dehydratase/UDP-glucuronate decarboxylase